MTEQEFIKMVRKELKDAGGKLILQRRQSLDEDLESTGTFELEGTDPIITCAKNNSDLLSILTHEFSHFQHRKTKIWEKYNNCKHGLEQILTNPKLHKHILPHLLLELDCERRAVKNIQKYNLPINIKDYAQKANVILFKYIAIYLGFYPWISTTDEQNKILARDMPDKILTLSELKRMGKSIYRKFSTFSQ